MGFAYRQDQRSGYGQPFEKNSIEKINSIKSQGKVRLGKSEESKQLE
jgi:hypothetical protein